MSGFVAKRLVLLGLLVLVASGFGFAQGKNPENKYESQEITDTGTPVLVEHLPLNGPTAPQGVFVKDLASLKVAVGERPVLDAIEFKPGTEAVAATYPAGKLVIIEFPTPQGSVDADARIREAIAGNSSIAYKRIGNYNALVFDVTDPAAANALLGQITYDKEVQWLGEPPAKSQRGVTVPQMANVILSSIVWLVGCGVLAILGGAVAGWLYWRRIKQRRASMTAFSDAGGITRLNLDGLTPDALPERLLSK
jgi:hypothetical protein